MLKIPNPDGTIKATVGAAGWETQLGQRNLLRYGDFKDLAQSIRSYRVLHEIPGVVDDFAWDHFTKPWARLALMTGSFAAHITLAEDFLNTARLGLKDMVKGEIDGAIARMGYHVARDEEGPITAFVYRALGSPSADEFEAMYSAPERANALAADLERQARTLERSDSVAAQALRDRAAQARSDASQGFMDVATGWRYAPMWRSPPTATWSTRPSPRRM